VSRLARRPSPSRDVIDFYASGLLHTEKDFMGVTIVGAKPGIIAASRDAKGTLHYETKLPHWIESHLRMGGELFCDSGAFTCAFTGQTLDFNRVFRFYLLLLNAARSPSQLILVMPDSVGEQGRTLALWEKYREGIAWWLRRSCVCLFPMQGWEYTTKTPGALSLVEMYQTASAMFKRVGGVAAALPMKKAATKPAAALDFVTATMPPHLHLLGMGRKTESVDLAVAMLRVSPQTVITADAVETTTAYGGRHKWTSPKFRAKVDARQKAKGGKRRDIWYRDRVTETRDDELDFWLPTPDMGELWQDQYDNAVQEFIVDALKKREISQRQADAALRSPAAARKLLRGKLRPYDAVVAMADHMMHRMDQVPVPQVNELKTNPRRRR
jgi:hypothetical protein